jgi:hypothetical protein
MEGFGMALNGLAAEYGELLRMKYEALVANYKRTCDPSQEILDSFRQTHLRDLLSHNILYVTSDLVTGIRKSSPCPSNGLRRRSESRDRSNDRPDT